MLATQAASPKHRPENENALPDLRCSGLHGVKGGGLCLAVALPLLCGAEAPSAHLSLGVELLINGGGGLAAAAFCCISLRVFSMALSALASSTAPAGEIANRAVTCTGGRLPSLALAPFSGMTRVVPSSAAIE